MKYSMMMNSDASNTKLTLGYELDVWNNYGRKRPISIDLSPASNSHILICGMSGSGKSYMEHAILAKLADKEPHGEIFFSDYKGDDTFAYLRDRPQMFTYKSTLQALDAVHARLLARQSGEDKSRNPITLVWDEYMAQALSLLSEDKKGAAAVLGKVSEILLLGRSLSVRFITVCQRPDALAFPAGSRLNYGVVCVLGAAVKSIYEMLLPDFKEMIEGRRFERGEGVVVLQGSELHFIKVPEIRDVEKMRSLCLVALSKGTDARPPCEA